MLNRTCIRNSGAIGIVFAISYFSVAAFLAIDVHAQVAKEMLQPTRPEEFIVNSDVNTLWQVLTNKVATCAGVRILVTDSDDHIVSWIEPNLASLATPKKAAQKSQSRPNASLLMQVDREGLRQAEVTEVGPDAISLTTAFVRARGNLSVIRLRRIYYGSRTQPKSAHSSGAYESWLADAVLSGFPPKPSTK